MVLIQEIEESPKAANGPGNGWRRMNIVEASDSEDEPPAAASQPANGWRRMNIVEASDSEDDVQPKSSGTAGSDPHPDLKVELSLRGAEEAKVKGNSFFPSKPEEAERWFSKALWVAQSEKVVGQSKELRSILHANRAICRLTLKRHEAADEDCTASLALNENNIKARYRRAVARFELGRLDTALEDVDKALEGLPDAQSSRDAVDLKRRIEEKLAIAQVSTEGLDPYPELKVDATKDGIEKAKNQGNNLFSQGLIDESIKCYAKGLWLLESKKVSVSGDLHSVLFANRAYAYLKQKKWAEAESDCMSALAANSKNVKAKFRLATTRVELRKFQSALEVVEEVIKELPDPQNKEAVELKQRIVEELQEVEETESQDVIPCSPKKGSARRKVHNFESPPDHYPEIEIEPSASGIEAAKEKGNTLFSKGSVEEAERWFSKALWLVEDSGQVQVPSELNSLLHSNRAFTRLRLQQYEGAKEDSFQALQLNPKNIKALYRRAQARFELNELQDALEDVEKLIPMLEPPANNREALDLKARILQKLREENDKAAKEDKPPQKESPSSATQSADTQVPPGFRRMQIVEVSDSEDEAPAKATPPSPAKAVNPPAEGFRRMQIVEASDSEDEKPKASSPAKASTPSQPSTSPAKAAGQPQPGFRRMQIVEASDSEDEKPTTTPAATKAIPPSSPAKASIPSSPAPAKASIPSSPAPAKAASQPPEGFRRMQIVEASDSEDEKPTPSVAAKAPAPTPNGKSLPSDPYPDIKIESSVSGIEKAKEQANNLFAKGSVEESERWFSKAIWLVEDAEVKVPSELLSTLHSNRAFTRMRQNNFNGAKEDGSKALELNPKNVKALYRKAQAEFELNELNDSLKDVEKLLPLLAPPTNREALEMKEKILERLSSSIEKAAKAEVEVPKPSPASPNSSQAPLQHSEGFRRLEIVEATDSEDEQPDPVPEVKDTTKPPEGFRRLQIVEASDSEDDKPTPSASSAKAPAPTPNGKSLHSDPYPDIEIEPSTSGVEQAKEKANSLFSKGSVEDSERWFSKAIWLIEEARKVKVPSDLLSTLHSNRAFARLRLQRYTGAKDDASEALKLNPKNVKALYRRAQAEFELGEFQESLKDVEQLLPTLAPPTDREALDLKSRILQRLEEKKTAQVQSAVKAPPSPTKDANASQPPEGFRRLQIVEASDSEDDQPTPSAPAKASPQAQDDPFPDLHVELSVNGIEKAKEQGNSSFTKGSVQESERWFSKGIWLAESDQVKVPSELLSTLHSNRAFTRIRLQRYPDAKEDCSKALKLNPKNVKALYRRAQSQFELGELEEALKDLEALLPMMGPPGNKEALDLKAKILTRLGRPDGPKVAEKTDSPKAVAEDSKDFEASKSFTGARPGWCFQTGPHGLGYYLDPKQGVPATASKPADGFRRLQIVEDDSEDDKPTPSQPSKTPTKAEAPADPFPDMNVEPTPAGVERAKEQANSLFANGSVREAERLFSKIIWLVEVTGQVKVSSELLSTLHSNRAFARFRLQQYPGVKEDASEALKLNPKNVKALYRRAQAEFELNELNDALQDVEKVLSSLEAPANKEALELKTRILQRLDPSKEQAKSEPRKMEDSTQPEAGFRRLQIVEASDSEDDSPAPASPATKAPQTTSEPYPDIQIELSVAGVEKAKDNANGLFSKGSVQEAERWFSKALWLVEDSSKVKVSSELCSILHSNRAFARIRLQQFAGAKADCSEALQLNSNNAKALYRRALAGFELGELEESLRDVEKLLPLLKAPANREAVELKSKILQQLEQKKPKADEDAKPPANGFRRLEIVEASDSEDDPTPSSASKAPATPTALDPFPDVQIEASSNGVERAKDHANGLFSKGSVEESERWFSKALWLIEDAGKVKVTAELQSTLHSNRAFTRLRLQRYDAAKEDSQQALKLNPKNMKAFYRQAQAEFELGQLDDALKDVEKLLPMLDASQNRDALDLKTRIQQRLDSSKKAEVPSMSNPTPSSPSKVPPTKSPDPYPDIHIEPTVTGVEQAKDCGNKLFADGSLDEAERWFSKAIWLIEKSGQVSVSTDLRSTLHSNRAFARLRLQRYADAEEDCCEALQHNPKNTKALYRRAQARLELDELEDALKDVERLLPLLSDPPYNNREALDLKAKILKRLGRSDDRTDKASVAGSSTPSLQKPIQVQTALDTPSVSSTSPKTVSPPQQDAKEQAPASAPVSPAGRRPALVKPVLGAPTVPTTSPRNAMELLRHFGAMKRHPDVLAQYLRLRVPPSLLQSIFSKSPIEADDLATTLMAIRNSAKESGPESLSPEKVGEYLRQLSRTLNAKTQFSMLSSSEKQVLRELMNMLSPPLASELQNSFQDILG